ncbi:hypothetical protein Tco_0937937 [Tanacetum coccineum]|uniref:Xylulose kinase-1 n=1 Tax=Tanacetum coccineum TaxID=301880 RepID=A0ABQ5DIB9_9ASTR
MADLAFVKQHNMVAYLDKTKENANFHQILDFLTSSSINFALTVSPTIYASYIEQFWNTASLKTINSEKQMHANVDGKDLVVSESSVRRDLHLNDEDGTACLTNNEIFENHALIMNHLLNLGKPCTDGKTMHSVEELGSKEVFNVSKVFAIVFEYLTSKFVTTVAASQLLKDPNTNRGTKRGQNTKVPQSGGSPNKVGDEAINEEMLDSVEKAATTASSLEAGQASVVLGTKKPWGGAPAQTRSERVLEKPNEPPLLEGHTSRSGEGSMEHTFELMDNVPPIPHHSPLTGGYTPGSDEGRPKLEELITMCTKLSK